MRIGQEAFDRHLDLVRVADPHVPLPVGQLRGFRHQVDAVVSLNESMSQPASWLRIISAQMP